MFIITLIHLLKSLNLRKAINNYVQIYYFYKNKSEILLLNKIKGSCMNDPCKYVLKYNIK